MSSSIANDVRAMLLDAVNRRLKELNRDQIASLPDEYDLATSGLIDSMYLMVLVSDVSEHFGREIDFTELDPSKMTIVGPLCAFISTQLANGDSAN